MHFICTKSMTSYQNMTTQKKNRPNWNVVHDDIANVDFSKVRADVVTGGFPCQAGVTKNYIKEYTHNTPRFG